MQTKKYKKVLVIAGSDSGGGAGIQADIKSVSALGCYAASAITCVTAQNTVGVMAIESLSVDMVKSQIHAVLSDIGVDAVKIGMLGSPEIAQAVADCLKGVCAPIVLDPVLVATSGDVLTKKETIATIINELVPLATVVTPNLEEALIMTGYDNEQAWQVLHRAGAKALLLKGGHSQGDTLKDRLYTQNGVVEFANQRVDTPNTHGTGCTLSSAIAAYLAHGEELELAVSMAIKYVHDAIVAGADYQLGAGHGAVHHFHKQW